ncbi:putative mitogen-activated protein kinase kinase kinase STE-STE11 family [Helianthus anomalus]
MDLNSGLKKRRLMSEDNDNDNNNNYNWERKRRNQASKYGNGMAWFRGCLIGKGCFGSVYLATLKNPKSKYSSYPPIMAVKSAEVSVSSSIQKEREVLNNIRGCRNVIRCFGDEITNGENGQMVYNLLLEYGSGGTLADLIKKSDGLPELDVKRYTRSILRGLRHIHRCGYVHCDLKPENILLVASGGSGGDQYTAKIGDLGLAKRAKQNKKGKLIVPYWRGTPMYFSPEVVIDGVQEAPSDIWAVGCIVLEMLTANPPWGPKGDTNSDEIITRIGELNESPLIVSTLSSEAKSFLKGCFSRKSMYRLTAEMLLAHPFLEGIDEDNVEDDDNNNNNVEDTGDVFDINAISSLIMSEGEDDEAISFSLFSDDLCSWSEEEDVTSASAPLNEVHHQYPITFTVV